MSTALASVLVAVVGLLGSMGGAALTWRRTRRTDEADLVARWEANYGNMLTKVADLQRQLDAEATARRELGDRLGRAMVRIDHLERLLTEAGIPFNGPAV